MGRRLVRTVRTRYERLYMNSASTTYLSYASQARAERRQFWLPDGLHVAPELIDDNKMLCFPLLVLILPLHEDDGPFLSGGQLWRV